MRFAIFGVLDGRPAEAPRPPGWMTIRRLTVRGLMILVLIASVGLHYVLEMRRDAAARALVAAMPGEAATRDAFRRVKALHAERAAAARLGEAIEADFRKGAVVSPGVARGSMVLATGAERGRSQVALELLRRLGSDGTVATSALVRTLRSEPTEMSRSQIVVTLGVLADHDDRAFDAVRETISAPEGSTGGASVRASYWAAFALGMMKSEAKKESAIPGLIDVVNRGDAPSREAALHALGFLGGGPPGAESACLKGLRDPDPNNRAEAARTLGAFGPLDGPIPEAIARLRQDPVESVRLMAEDATMAICRRRDALSNPSPPASPHRRS